MWCTRRIEVDMAPWLAVLLGVVVALIALAVVGVFAARDPALRALIDRLDDLGWRRGARGVWGLVRDPRVPLLVRLIPVPVLIYLFTPIDLIPDFIPILGQADDVLIVAAALWLMLRFTPREVIEEHFGLGD